MDKSELKTKLNELLVILDNVKTGRGFRPPLPIDQAIIKVEELINRLEQAD